MNCINLQGDVTLLKEGDPNFTFLTSPGLAWLSDGRLIYARQRDTSATGTELWALAVDLKHRQALGKPTLMHSLENRIHVELTSASQANKLLFQGRRRENKSVLFDVRDKNNIDFRELKTRGKTAWPRGWSPDGKFMVFNEMKDEMGYQVAIKDLVTGEMFTLPDCPEDTYAAGFGPSSEFILVSDKSNLLAVPLGGGPVKNLGHSEFISHGLDVFIPRGGTDKFLLEGHSESLVIIFEVSLENGIGPEVFRYERGGEGFTAGTYFHTHISRDLKKFAIVEYSPEIRIVDMASGENTVWHIEQGTVTALRWSWDDQWIYCTGNDGLDYDFWMGRIDPTDGRFELLDTTDKYQVNWPFPSPDGNSVFGNLIYVGTDLYMLEGL